METNREMGTNSAVVLGIHKDKENSPIILYLNDGERWDFVMQRIKWKIEYGWSERSVACIKTVKLDKKYGGGSYHTVHTVTIKGSQEQIDNLLNSIGIGTPTQALR